MKKINYALVGLVGSALLFSCGENNPMKKIKEAKDGISAVSDLVSAGSGVMKDMKDLSELTPLTQQDFEKWAPGQSFWGLERTEQEFGEQLATASMKLVYGHDQEADSKRLQIIVIDGADQQGGQLMIAQMNIFLNSDLIRKEMEEHGQERIVDKHGQRAKEYYSGGENHIETIVNERFYLKLAGYNMEVDEVWEAFKALKTDKLK